MTRSATREI